MKVNPIVKADKGRGSQHNPANKFLQNSYEWESEYLEHCRLEGEEYESKRTVYQEIHPKTIVTAVNSIDVPFKWSINPYQGCEHGCVYCYARNSHEYYGYSAGKDFERIVLVKKNAPELLKKYFLKRNYQPELIMLSGNTDCYQPAEQKFKITRQLLKLCLLHKHPVGIITKNSLILRDLDIIKELHQHRLIKITLSITSLDEHLRRALEPRTASIQQRLRTLKALSEIGIQVNVNLAPIIPGLNNHEVFDLVKTIADHGAASASYIMVRLNGQIADIFEAWVKQTYPQRASKIINQIKETHGGKLNDSRWKTRMRGQGKYAEQVKDMFHLAQKKFLPQVKETDLNFSDFTPHPETPTLF